MDGNQNGVKIKLGLCANINQVLFLSITFIFSDHICEVFYLYVLRDLAIR